ncbi:MAG: hypothetical protein HN790_15030 [Methylococcales bacterium]|nr:hypothetical protein [Methylococcales bacterium]
MADRDDSQWKKSKKNAIFISSQSDEPKTKSKAAEKDDSKKSVNKKISTEQKQHDKKMKKVEIQLNKNTNKIDNDFSKRLKKGYYSKGAFEKANEKRKKRVNDVHRKAQTKRKELRDNHRQNTNSIYDSHNIKYQDRPPSLDLVDTARYSHEKDYRASKIDIYLNEYKDSKGKIDVKQAKTDLLEQAKDDGLTKGQQKQIGQKFDEHIEHLKNNGAKQGLFLGRIAITEKQSTAVSTEIAATEKYKARSQVQRIFGRRAAKGLDKQAPDAQTADTELDKTDKSLESLVDRDSLDRWDAQVKGSKAQAPLSNKLSESSKAEYEKVAKRLRDVPLEKLPDYLEARSNEVKRSTWWKDHAVARRELKSAEQQAFDRKDADLGKRIQSVRYDLQKQSYAELRTEPSKHQQAKSRQPLNESGYKNLLDHVENDHELHDSLVISRETGLRPQELQNGVKLTEKNGAVTVEIQGAKKRDGVEGAARFRANTGADRTLTIKSDKLAEVAQKNNGHFEPNSSKDALRARLNRARSDVEGAENITFYSFRHNHKTELANLNTDKTEIQRQMGHQSEKSQDAYGYG